MSEYKEYVYNSAEMTLAHKYLANAILKLLDPNKNKIILDVGCGNGALSNYLSFKGFSVYGIDASQMGIKIANQTNPGKFFIHDLSSDAIPEEIKNIVFDTIISTEVIEHLYAPRNYIKFCQNILSKTNNGQLIISTPYHGYLKNVLLSLTGKMDAHFNVLWDGGHIKFWSKSTLYALLHEFGFTIRKFIGVGRVKYLWKSMIVCCELP